MAGKILQAETLAAMPIAVALSLCLLAPAAQADAYYDQGVKLYQKKDYAHAAQYFEESIKNAPWESSSFYYAGLAYQSLGQWEKAKEKYRAIVEKFPGSQAYQNATTILKRIDPGYFTKKNDPPPTSSVSSGASSGGSSSQSAGSSASGADSDMAKAQFSGPQQSRVVGQKQGDKLYVDVQVGSSTLKMAYDPGQSDTIVTKKDAARCGLTGAKPLTSVRVGQVSATNFPVQVQEATENALGQKFFRDFTATVDNVANTITIQKKGAAVAGGVAVPFSKQSGKMYVDVQINGRSCKMQFDPTGSECTLPKTQAKSLGLKVDETTSDNMYNLYTNPTGVQRGDPGYGDAKTEASADATVKLGPLVKSGVHFKIDEGSNAQAKFGGSVLGGNQYTIDDAASVIRFK